MANQITFCYQHNLCNFLFIYHNKMILIILETLIVNLKKKVNITYNQHQAIENLYL